MKLSRIVHRARPILCAQTERGLFDLSCAGYHTFSDALNRPDSLPDALALA